MEIINLLPFSVIFLTYNASENALISTLKSIVSQKNCGFEIIISDDGSNTKHLDATRLYFEHAGFTDYKIIEKEKNEGTVKIIFSRKK